MNLIFSSYTNYKNSIKLKSANASATKITNKFYIYYKKKKRKLWIWLI